MPAQMMIGTQQMAGSSHTRSRRRFLLSAPALTIFGMAAPYLMAGESNPPDRCTLTAADSLVLVDSIMPGVSWIEHVGPITLDLKHFNSVVVINPDASLAWEWPDASLKRS